MKKIIFVIVLALLALPAFSQVRFSQEMTLNVEEFNSVAYDDVNVWANDISNKTLTAFDPITGEKMSSVALSASGECLAFDGMKLLMTQNETKQIAVVNRSNGDVVPYIDLKNIQGQRDMYMEPLRSGEIMSIAVGNEKIWVGCGSGYSSSIYEIDPVNQVVLSHRFAPGPTPASLLYHKGDLWVMDKDSQTLRCIKETRQLVYDLSIPVGENSLSLLNMRDNVFVARKGHKVFSGIEKNSLSNIVPASVTLEIVNRYETKNRNRNMATGERKVAVLISGDTAASGYNEFWVDVVIMYQILEKQGYKEIYVLYADGKDYVCGWDKYEKKMTDFAATKSNVNKILQALAYGDSSLGINKMSASDTLFVYTFDHGASNGKLCLWAGEYYSPSEMSAVVRNIPATTKMFYMQQCFSGAFKEEFKNVGLADAVIVTAASNKQYAYRADTEKENYNGKMYYHGEFNWHFMSALAKVTPNGQAVNADLNGDGKISVLETSEYYKKMNSQSSQTPQYFSNPEALGNTIP